MNLLNHPATARRSPMGLALVVGLHALFVYALIMGVGTNRSLTQESPPLIVIPDQDRSAPRDPSPAPADPTLIPVVPVDVPIPNIPFDDAPTALADPVPMSIPQGPGTADVVPSLMPARVDPRHPLSQPPYPASSIRKEEEGTLTLALRVQADGRVAEATVTRSSGFPQLDEAAVIEAKRRWRLLPAMRGSTAIEGWTNLKVIFRLDQR